jgi:predicted RNase H-like HicB family nuclease
MQKFEYGFSLELINNDYYQLRFLDIPSLVLTAPTVDKIFTQAQASLDTYLYDLLKKGSKIPLPKTNAPNDKRISPSDAIKMALEFYVTE